MQNDLNFYRNIAKNNVPLSELLTKESLFFPVPNSWYIIVADIENSTESVQKGAHNDVNLSATGKYCHCFKHHKRIRSKNRDPILLWRRWRNIHNSP